MVIFALVFCTKAIPVLQKFVPVSVVLAVKRLSVPAWTSPPKTAVPVGA